MPRPKKPSAPADSQAALPEQQAKPCPAILEYQPKTESGQWRVERFELLASEFGLPDIYPDIMSGFHDLVKLYRRQWLIVRRLYGVMPIIPAADAQPDDMRVHSRAEICTALGIDAKDLQSELDAVRAVYQQQINREREAKLKEAGPTKTAVQELNLGGNDLLEEFDFDEQMFETEAYDPRTKMHSARSTQENLRERAWFLGRVEKFRKMLSEPMAASLARECLVNELHLRRLGQEMTKFLPTSPKWQDLLGAKKAIEQAYQEQLEKLNDIFPWESEIGGKISFRGCVSEIVDAYYAYKAKAETALIDKIHTAAEIEILYRMSVQMPEPRYRLGANLYFIEAMQGLHDPQWKSALKPSLLRKADVAFQQALVTLREQSGERLVDLEKEGDEFPEIVSETPELPAASTPTEAPDAALADS